MKKFLWCRSNVFSTVIVAACALVLCKPVVAGAETVDPILSLPEGHVILAISATERREVTEDLLIASLAVSARNTDSAVVQDEINSAMTKALEATAKETDVQASTGSYQVYEITEPRTKEKKWQGRQSLVLKSKKQQALLGLVADLQGLGFTVNSLNYTLAPQTAVTLKDEMLEAALGQLQTRAARAAKALGKSKAELKDVSVLDGNNIPGPQPANYMPRMEMAAANVTSPVAQAGETTVTLTVSARAILKP